MSLVRERITITIKDDLLKQVDRIVDGLTIRSRSQAVEFLLTKFLSDFRLNNALVLAGGRAQNINIDGNVKFLADVKGKPLIEKVLEKIHDFNVNNFLVYADTQKEKIMAEFNSKNLGFSVSFIEGDKPTGTIDPLLRAKSYLKDTFLVAYGDTVANINLNEMLSFHRKNNSLATIALTTVSNPSKYGAVKLEGSKVREFIEKPKDVGSYLVSAGYFLFEPEIFKHISRNMRSIEKDLFPKLTEKGLLYGYPFQGLYINVHSKSDLEKARVLL